MNSADLARLGCQYTAGFARFDFGCFLIEAGKVAVELEQIDGQLFLKMGQVGLGGFVFAGQGNTIANSIFMARLKVNELFLLDLRLNVRDKAFSSHLLKSCRSFLCQLNPALCQCMFLDSLRSFK